MLKDRTADQPAIHGASDPPTDVDMLQFSPAVITSSHQHVLIWLLFCLWIEEHHL